MSFPRYPKYKASGVEWLDEVPESWEVRRIKHLGKTITGGTPKTEEPEYWTDGDVPWLPSGKVQNNSIHKGDADTFITKRALAESAAKLIQPGSALIALTGATCANAAFLTFESTANQSVVGIEPKLNADGRFIYYSLLSQREQVLTHKSGGAQGGINQEDVRNLVITAPKKVGQTAIAEFLDRETGKIDELVAEQRRLMGLLKEKRQAVISHAVTQGRNPYAPMKPSGIEWLGDVPQGWEVRKVSQLFRAGKGKNGQMLTKEFCGANEGAYPVYSGQTENEGVMGTWDQFEFDFGEAGVLFSTTVGAKAMHLRQLFGRFSLSQNCMIIWPSSRRCITRFFYYHFQPLFQWQRSMIPDHMQPSFRMEDLYGCMIALPPQSEQAAIVEFLDTELAQFDTLTAEAQRAIDLLQERRTALISAAVTGQIDVRHPPKN